LKPSTSTTTIFTHRSFANQPTFKKESKMSNFNMAPFESNTITDAINKTKYAGNGVISRAGLFDESGIATTSAVIDFEDNACQRRLNIDPPCRSNIDPGRVAEF
jgi:hypothetical protein